jgi:hypothetical protein
MRKVRDEVVVYEDEEPHDRDEAKSWQVTIGDLVTVHHDACVR